HAPALPPFPTRRSSDLSDSAFRSAGEWIRPRTESGWFINDPFPIVPAPGRGGDHRAGPAARALRRPPRPTAGPGGGCRRCPGTRSEEHTSELQSLAYLV